MWTVVYLAKTQDIALNIEKLLIDEKIASKIKPVSKKTTEGNNYYEVLVKKLNVETAHRIIIEEGI